MKLLFLAPQPFFQERGTPIAVRLALQVIAERFAEQNDSPPEIDLVTYPEGGAVSIPGVTIHRISVPGFLGSLLKGVTPGVSLKKLLLDVLFFFKVAGMMWRNRRDQYRLVHAVEEAVFVALVLRCFFGVPYLYDMDSSLAMQVTEKWSILKPLYPMLAWLEKVAVRNSMAVAPVCDALSVIALRHGAKQSVVLRDVSLFNPDTIDESVNLRAEVEVPKDALLVLYVGNLEHYQGIDLLLESFARISSSVPEAILVIIGGSESHRSHYASMAERLGVINAVRLAGTRPVSQLGDYIMQADILVSPRVRGNNTPMKIYSYLHSGRAILATDLPTHTQVLTSTVALLTPPEVEQYASGLRELITNEALRARLGRNGRALADERYTFGTFRSELNRLYDQVDRTMAAPASEAKAL